MSTQAAHLLTTFQQHLPDALRAQAEALDDLDARLLAFVEAGQQRWPELPLEPAHFCAELAQRLHANPPRKTLESWLGFVQPADFHLALACAQGQQGAIEAFERLFHGDIHRLIARYAGPNTQPDDLLQSLREKLFVHTPDRPARITDYAGQGYLQNWLRVAGARTFIDLLRAATRRTDKEDVGGDEPLLDAASPAEDLELDFLKREYRGHFKAAFADAIQRLDGSDRVLLRQALVSRLTVEQLGALYGVHASTASRRVSKARETLLSHTREALLARLKLQRDEFDSILDLIRSRLDLSMTRLLSNTLDAQDPPT